MYFRTHKLCSLLMQSFRLGKFKIVLITRHFLNNSKTPYMYVNLMQVSYRMFHRMGDSSRNYVNECELFVVEK